jgi:uncharacterized protein with PQ loop repeat
VRYPSFELVPQAMTDLPYQTGMGPQSGQEKPQGAAATPKRMFDPETFALEEYKVTHAKISQQRDAVSRLEALLIGSTVVAVGVLLGIGRTPSDLDKVSGWPSLFAWWALFLVVLTSTFRCWSHYGYIIGLRKYVVQIEKKMTDAGYELDGLESYSEVERPRLLYVVAFLISGVLNAVVLFLAILKSLSFAGLIALSF